jgi:DNA-binding beta-propeller fold protein YncE
VTRKQFLRLPNKRPYIFFALIILLFLSILLIRPFSFADETQATKRMIDPNMNPEIPATSFPNETRPTKRIIDQNTNPEIPETQYFCSNPNQPSKKAFPPPQSPRPLGFYDYEFYKSFGGYGLGNGYFKLPVDICIDRDDNIYVCDMELESGRIQIFNSEGNFKDEWGGLSIQQKDIDEPNALYVDYMESDVDYEERADQTIIYVADTRNNRILQFNKDGKWIPEPDDEEIQDKPNIWGEFGSREGQFHHPTDITVDNHDHCYVLDSKNSRIQCFKANGEFKFEWGGFGSGPGSFLKPTRLAYDPSGFGSIWVIESKGGKLHQFDLDGDFIKSFIPKDKNNNPLSNPSDLCFDTQGFLYITDSAMNKVFKYNNDVEFIQCWGEEGSKPGQFKNPKGIAVDSEDRVLVVDSGNFRIQIFRHF